MTIKREPVLSTAMVSMGYDPEKQTLEVEFNDGKVFQYHDVPESVYAGHKFSESVGKWFHNYIRKGQYKFTRVS